MFSKSKFTSPNTSSNQQSSLISIRFNTMPYEPVSNTWFPMFALLSWLFYPILFYPNGDLYSDLCNYVMFQRCYTNINGRNVQAVSNVKTSQLQQNIRSGSQMLQYSVRGFRLG